MPRNSQATVQRQKQLLRLNQRQMMLGRLLEMSTPEFEEEIVRQIEENPAISTIEQSDDRADGAEREPEVDEDDYEVPLSHTGRLRDGFYQHAHVQTVAESIESQLSELNLTDLERETAHYIIGNLDSSGYLTRSAAAIADDMALTAGVDVPVATVEKMIRTVKELDPAGIGAENLRECLLLQLKRLPGLRIVELAREIIGRHYKLFANNRLDMVKDSTGATDEEFPKAMALIKSLNPKPGAGLFDIDSDDRAGHISHDFIIDYDDRGRATVTLAGHIPDLIIEPSFRIENIKTTDPRAIEFIKERSEGAEEFIDAVKRRGTTLLAIMKAIISLQPEFFQTFEPHSLKPMVIRDIEALTGLDKSVISRATSSKYMLTPEGMFSLKSLFGESASSASVVSAREVEHALEQIVGQEDKTSPLSDDELTSALIARGLPVARRTVAKYRENLGIPVARLRKQTI